MRKGFMFLLFVMSVSILLMGCGKDNEIATADDLINDFQGTGKVEVESSDGEVLTSISDEKDIEDFVNALKLEAWEMQEIPTEAVIEKTFIIYRKDTVKLFQGNNQKSNLKEVVTLTTYKDVPYIKFKMKSFEFNFKVPNDVSAYLNDFEKVVEN